MGFFSFMLFFLILLLLIIIIGSIQQFTIWAVTKKMHEFIVMIIPALLSIVSFLIIITITYLTLNLFDINSIKIVYSIFMKWDYSFNNYIYMIIGYIIGTILFILLQALCLKLVYINYKKIYDFIRIKIFKKEEIKALDCSEEDLKGKVSINLSRSIAVPIKNKLAFFQAFSASLFTFSICFFSILLLIYIGTLIGKHYIL